jgi:low temperature requirement protein LtrA
VRRLHRRDADVGVPKAASLELFFDLVYVFALNELAQYVVRDEGPVGLARGFVLLAAIWWAWLTWTLAANPLDPDNPLVRAVTLVCGLLSVFMSLAIPLAYADRAPLFALCYTAIRALQLGLVAYAARREHGPRVARPAVRVLWLGALGLWIVGAYAPHGWQTAVWALAVAVDYAAPLVPGALAGITVSLARLAERIGLFVLIALGETILSIGGAVEGVPLTLAKAAVIAIAFCGLACLWWTYFEGPAAPASYTPQAVTHVARDAYAYAHLVIVAGIVAYGVGTKLAIGDPHQPLNAYGRALLCGGVGVYLLGNVLYRRLCGLRPGYERLLAGVVCVSLLTLLAHVDALQLSALVLAALVVLISYETVLDAPREGEVRAAGA